MVEPFATYPDIEAVWRPLTEAERTVAPALLEVASAIIRARFADIDARIASGALSAVLVRQVTVAMVRRYMEARGPSSPTQQSLGDFSEAWAAADDDGPKLWLTEDDLGLLRPPGGGRPRSHRLGLGICPP